MYRTLILIFAGLTLIGIIGVFQAPVPVESNQVIRHSEVMEGEEE